MTATVTATVLCNPMNCAYSYVIDLEEYVIPLFTYIDLL